MFVKCKNLVQRMITIPNGSVCIVFILQLVMLKSDVYKFITYFNSIYPLITSVEMVTLGLVFSASATFLQSVPINEVVDYFKKQRQYVIALIIIYLTVNYIYIFDPVSIDFTSKVITTKLAIISANSFAIWTLFPLFELVSKQLKHTKDDMERLKAQKKNFNTAVDIIIRSRPDKH